MKDLKYQNEDLQRENEKTPTVFKINGNDVLSIFGNFKKKAKEYFKDCPSIVKKIKSGKYKKTDIIEIVEYYNVFCAEIQLIL